MEGGVVTQRNNTNSDIVDVQPMLPDIYGEMEMPKRAMLERCAKSIEKIRSKGVELIFQIGEQLKIAHDELANHGDGTFGKWCKERLGISTSSAHNYLSVVDTFGSQKLLDLPSLGRTFTAESLYYLSRDTTPEEATRDALKVAKKGERVTLQVAKGLAEKYTCDEIEDADTEGDEIEEREDEDDVSTWDIMQCELALTREARQWWSLCPEPERKRLPELLRHIATNLEKRLHGNPS